MFYVRPSFTQPGRFILETVSDETDEIVAMQSFTFDELFQRIALLETNYKNWNLDLSIRFSPDMGSAV